MCWVLQRKITRHNEKKNERGPTLVRVVTESLFEEVTVSEVKIGKGQPLRGRGKIILAGRLCKGPVARTEPRGWSVE